MTSSTRTQRRLLRSGLVLAAALSLAACGGSGEGATGDGGSGSLTEVTFGATQTPSSIGTVAALMKEHKFAEQCGVAVEFREFAPQEADIALLSGQTDIGYFGYNSWAGSEEKLQKLAMLAPLQAEHGTLFVPEDSPVQSLEDLRGKRIGMLASVSGQYQDFSMLAAEMGFALEEDFEVVTGPPPGVEAFLKRGEVDAAILFEPNSTRVMLEGGFRPLFSLTEQWESLTGQPLYMLGVSANQAWLEGNEEAAACVVSAVHQATDILANDPSAYEGLEEVLGATSPEYVERLADDLGKIYTPGSAEETEAAIRAQLEKAAQYGILPEVPEKIFTPLGA
jgi:ABC-type nitrate/sulfonate/bicarbonate transport system substrate-binding protein